MALWADDGAGHPGAYVTQTATFAVTAGLIKAPPVPLVGPTLTAGKIYWIGAKFASGARLFQNGSSGAKGYTTPQAFASAPNLLAPFPTTAGTFSDTVLNFVLFVQDTPP